ncbi:hypothetical protein KC573_00195, partial [candidate division WWE3 bacterium]|nr:hypothetical protein [candidate division WWE3 bacterium]
MGKGFEQGGIPPEVYTERAPDTHTAGDGEWDEKLHRQFRPLTENGSDGKERIRQEAALRADLKATIENSLRKIDLAIEKYSKNANPDSAEESLKEALWDVLDKLAELKEGIIQDSLAGELLGQLSLAEAQAGAWYD